MRPDLYDLFSDEKVRIPRERPLLTEAASGSPAREHGVLDVSCGTGIHARFYAGLGYEVTARDISEESLDRARKNRPHEHIIYETGDMRVSQGKVFGLVLATGNSISALPSRRDLDAMMLACEDQLVSGGKLLVQTLDYETFRNDGRRCAAKTGDSSGVPVIVAKTMAFVGGDFVVSFTTIERGSDGVWKSESHATRLNPWSPNEIRGSAASAGLEVEAEYSSYAKEPFMPGGGGDYIVIFGKPSG